MKTNSKYPNKQPQVRVSKARGLALIGLTIGLLGACRVPAAEEKDGIFGHWRAVAVLDSADIAGMSDTEARRLIGLCMEIEPEVLRFAGEECTSPGYQRTSREPVRYLREQWHARSGKLNLPNPVTVIDAGCTDLFMRDQSRMIFNWEGFFYDARRVESSQCRSLPQIPR